MTQDERKKVIPLATKAALASVAMALFLLALKGSLRGGRARLRCWGRSPTPRSTCWPAW
ncbi:hypothetical protein GCM10020258_24790 [Sphingomonas yabuuchiae]